MARPLRSSSPISSGMTCGVGVGSIAIAGLHRSGLPHEFGALVEGNRQRHRQAFGDLLRGAQIAGFDLAEGDGGAAHAPGEFFLGQVERAAALANLLAEGVVVIHRFLL